MYFANGVMSQNIVMRDSKRQAKSFVFDYYWFDINQA